MSRTPRIACCLTFVLAGAELAAAKASADPAPEPPSSNRILSLYDAFGKELPGVTQDWGFSCLIDYEGKHILFDAGLNADIFAQNVKALGVDLGKIDFAIGSHAHPDHLSGFDHLLKVNPRVKIYLPVDFYCGAPIPFSIAGADAEAADALPPEQRYYHGSKNPAPTIVSSGRFWGANVEFVNGSKEIAPGITLIATSSALMGYFSKYPPNQASPSLNGLPELSLSLRTKEGEVVIVGCSHSSVETILDADRAFLKRDLALLMGGFHLLPYGSSDITNLAQRLRDDYRVSRIAPAHCTGHLAFKIFREIFGERDLFAGLGSEIPFAAASP
jgi:7,8-dihydropterin-6-yl-methyl-4-(beta-D-ribofuranosyl)aminobenzene 5'-phosphate synthase